jgi:hypothetical protein
MAAYIRLCHQCNRKKDQSQCANTSQTESHILSPVSYDQNTEIEELHRSSSRTFQKFSIQNPNKLNPPSEFIIRHTKSKETFRRPKIIVSIRKALINFGSIRVRSQRFLTEIIIIESYTSSSCNSSRSRSQEASVRREEEESKQILNR